MKKAKKMKIIYIYKNFFLLLYNERDQQIHESYVFFGFFFYNNMMLQKLKVETKNT